MHYSRETMLQVSVSSAVMVTSPPRGAQSIVMSMSVCLSVHQRNSKTKYLIFTIFFLCTLPAAMPRPSSDGAAIHHVFPVLWTTCFHSMGPMGQNQAWRGISLYFNEFHQVAAPVGRRTTSVLSSSSECGTGGEICYPWLPLFPVNFQYDSTINIRQIFSKLCILISNQSHLTSTKKFYNTNIFLIKP